MTPDSIMSRILLILCFGTSFIATCYGSERKCYLGSISGGMSSLKIIQCNSHSKNPEVKGKADTSQNSTLVTHCQVFTHNLKGDSNSATTDFDCDYDNICSNGISVVKKANGTFHCCNGSLCNSPSLVGLKMPALKCYTGTVTGENTSMTSSYCSSQFCVSTKYYNPSKSYILLKGTNYKCDDEKICNQYNILNGCKNVTAETGTLQLCCCTTSNCNKYVVNEVQPMGTLPPMDNSHSNMMYIGGVVAATVVAVLVVSILIIVIRKCQQRKDEHVRYIYSQLTADLSEELDDDDAYMIVA